MNRTALVCTTIASLTLAGAALLLAGPLNPPAGPVASSYKTLTEVEPRVAVNGTNTPGDADSLFRITQPGSYYLTGNVAGVANKHGIEVAADNVTVDLCGFTLAGAGGSRDAIRSDGGPLLTGLVVRTGKIRGWRGGSALSAGGIAGVVVEDLVIKSNGFEGVWAGARARVEGCSVAGGRNGIRVGAGSTISRCTTESTAERGIDAANTCVVEGCAARLATWDGIVVGDGGVVDRCSANDNGRSGIVSGIGGNVIGCSVRANDSPGILVGDGSVVRACVAHDNGSDGIFAGLECLVEGCTANENLGAGVHVNEYCAVLNNICTANIGGFGDGVNAGYRNRIEGNTLCVNVHGGVVLTGTGNFVVRNFSTYHNGSNYLYGNGNFVGTIVATEAAMNAAANANVNLGSQ